MKTSEKLKTLLDHCPVLCKSHDGWYKVFTQLNTDGYLYGKAINRDEKKSIIEETPIQSDYSPQHIDQYWQIIRPLPKKHVLLKVGDFVDIDPIAKECGDYYKWCIEAQAMIGQKGSEIKCTRTSLGDFGYDVYTKDKSNYYYFPHWCVTPHFQDVEETIEIDGKKYNRDDVKARLAELDEVKE